MRAAAGSSRCRMCAKVKPLSEFYETGGSICTTCKYDQTRSNKLMREYGLTLDDYAAIFDHQGGVCAMCQKPPKTNRLSVDHRHGDGLTRGLLCGWCNSVLGVHNDDADYFQRAADYLRRPTAPVALGREVFGKIGKTRKPNTWAAGIYSRRRVDADGWRTI